jgi:hypothetical protein
VYGLPALEQWLSVARLEEKLGKLEKTTGEVDVMLPKFKMEAQFGLSGLPPRKRSRESKNLSAPALRDRFRTVAPAASARGGEWRADVL